MATAPTDALTHPEQPMPSLPGDKLAVRTPRALMMAAALTEEREQRALLRKYVAEFMIPGDDYGTIPGTERKGLFKPGAEKLLDLFRCRPEYEFLTREVNHETGLYYYEIRCKAVSRETDTVLNEGVGSASSYESKYRYRNALRKCPACGKETIRRSKFKMRSEDHGTPPCWWCDARNGGCGKEYTHNAPEIVKQEAGKIQNPDLADMANTVLKMAKKRAQVDCAIALARVSDLFTQDIEDLPDLAGAAESLQEPVEPPERQKPPPRASPPAEPPSEAPSGPSEPPREKNPVEKLWDKAVAKWGDEGTKARWRAAAAKVFDGKRPPPSKDWREVDVLDMEAVLFEPTDVPF